MKVVEQGTHKIQSQEPGYLLLSGASSGRKCVKDWRSGVSTQVKKKLQNFTEQRNYRSLGGRVSCEKGTDAICFRQYLHVLL